MTFACIKASDGRKKGLMSDWKQWLMNADTLYNRLTARLGDSPFQLHEVASVGFLASAAAMAGFLPVNEYDIVKKGRSDKREKVPGRADLWFDAGIRCYSFEFKRAWAAATSKNLSASLKLGLDDVNCIQHDEYHYAAAGLLAVVSNEDRLPVYLDFAKSDDVDFAYRIGPEGKSGAFIYFKLKE
jgi:hypothetical protein